MGFDWNAYQAANGVGKNELRSLGAQSGATNVYQAIQANNYARYYNPATWGSAFLGNSYSSSTSNTGNSSNNTDNTTDSTSNSIYNNIFTMLKNILSHFGINIDSSSGSDTSDSSDSSSSSEIDESKVKMTGNPEEDAKNYAKKMGISVAEAKKQLKAKYGEPSKKSTSDSSSSTTGSTSSSTSSSSTDSSSSSTTSSSDSSSSTKSLSDYTEKQQKALKVKAAASQKYHQNIGTKYENDCYMNLLRATTNCKNAGLSESDYSISNLKTLFG